MVQYFSIDASVIWDRQEAVKMIVERASLTTPKGRCSETEAAGLLSSSATATHTIDVAGASGDVTVGDKDSGGDLQVLSNRIASLTGFPAVHSRTGSGRSLLDTVSRVTSRYMIYVTSRFMIYVTSRYTIT